MSTTEDELAARRAAGEIDPETLEGMEDQTPKTGEADDGQFFVWEHGKKVTLGTLIARGTPVETHWVFGRGRKKGSGGGMPGMNDDILLVIRGKSGKYVIVPTRDDDENVTKVAIEIQVVPKVIEDADSDSAMDLLRGIIETRVLGQAEAA